MHIAWASDLCPLCKLLRGYAKTLASTYVSFCYFVLLTCSMHISVNIGSDWKLAHLQTAASISAEGIGDTAWLPWPRKSLNYSRLRRNSPLHSHKRLGADEGKAWFLAVFLDGRSLNLVESKREVYLPCKR